MTKDDFLRGFAALGQRCGTLTNIVIAGGSALLLADLVDRETGDGDALDSTPKLSTFARDTDQPQSAARRLENPALSRAISKRSSRQSERLMKTAPHTGPHTAAIEDLVTQRMREWTRLGVMFTVRPSRLAVDVETLIAETAVVAPHNERLFVMAATWLAARHHFVDARRLGAAVETLDPHSSAVAGAMLSVAAGATSGKTALHVGIAHCRPIAPMEPLFRIIAAYPGLLALTQAETLAVYRQWGFWHNDTTLKFDALRPVRWTLHHYPELRTRALLGSGLDAQVIDALTPHPHTVTELTALTGATYAATYAATTRLAGRGLLHRPTDHGPKVWRVTPSFTKAVQLAFT